jgi:hypothetical protein
MKNNSEIKYLDIKSNNFRLLSLLEKEDWASYINKLPESKQDVYFSSQYYEVYEKHDDGKALCFIFENGNDIAIYPFLINRINDIGYELDDSYYFIEGAYGYNGVCSTTDNPEFIKSFYDVFRKICIENNIIVEFTRFHPLLSNHVFSKDYLEVMYNRQTVYVDLTNSYDSIYKNYSRSAKNNLAHAVVNNLHVLSFQNEFPYQNEFIEMYTETMDRVNSDKYLYFNKSFFANTLKLPSSVQFVVFKDAKPIASSICLFSKNLLHVHFTASKTDYMNLRPNNLLFDEIIKYGIQKKNRKIYLGGGVSNASDDSLLRFKSNFSKEKADFYIGKYIYNTKIYFEVLNQWSIKYPHLVDKYRNKVLAFKFIS